MLLIPTLSALLLFLIPQVPPTDSAAYDKDGWKAAADFLLEAIDTSANPCKNFYQFACGKWHQTYKDQYIGEPQKTIKRVAEQLLKALQNIRVSEPSTPQYQKSLKIFFDQCLNVTDDTSEIMSRMYNETAKIFGHMPLIDSSRIRRRDPYFLIGRFLRLVNTKVFLDVAVMSSQEKCETKPHLTLYPAFTERLLLKMNDSFAESLQGMSAAMGRRLNVALAKERIREMLEFEKNITEILKVDAGKEPETYRLSDLRKLNRRVNWNAFFTGLFPPNIIKPWKQQNPVVVIYGHEFFKNLDKYVDQLGLVRLMDYFYLKLLNFVMQDYTITPSLLQENSTALSYEFQCVEYVLKYASAAAARVFFESLGSKTNSRTIWNWKHDLELLAEAVFAASRYMIHTAEWLNVEDKARIVEKVNSIQFVSGIPQWILNDTAVMKHTPPYDESLSMFENDLRMYRQKFEWSLEPLMTGQALPLTAKFDGGSFYWDPDPNFSWNAYYFEQSVNLWMGLTLPPIYNYSYPLALKFGLMGWIIGHELFHGFDQGRVTEKVVGSKRWLSQETIKEFEKRVQCIIKQYSGYCYPEQNFCISGDTTLNDNIADLDGIKVAYMAYKFVTQSGGKERPLPGLERFTQDQLFFLSAARIWCGTGQDVEIYRTGDAHAPGRARVELSMMNFPAFAQAFRCPTGSKFAPLHTCTLWGDFLEPNIDEKAKRK